MKNTRASFKNAKRVVIKVGTSTLTYDNGNFNLQRFKELAFVLSDLKNKGLDIVLVSSGAIAAGVSKKGLQQKPKETSKKQALAGIGQHYLMNIYDDVFSTYNTVISQALFTKDAFDNRERRQNARNTFNEWFEYGVIPIVNENDTVAYKEIEFGDNDTLSAYVSRLVEADVLIILSDIDGLYNKDPNKFKDAQLIPEVKNIAEVEPLAKGSSSELGTGGMITKLEAARIASKSSIPTVITNGNCPENIRYVLEGKEIGTLFVTKSRSISPLKAFKGL